MNVSSATAAWIAIGAAALAVVALRVVVWLLSRHPAPARAARQVLLGDGKTDLVDFAVSLQGRIDDLHRAVDEIAAGLARVDRRVDGSVTKTSIVRYDAYEDTGGHQSASLAVLDSARTGVVVTAIQGRDYARIYMKELDRGRASIALSPEEEAKPSRGPWPARVSGAMQQVLVLNASYEPLNVTTSAVRTCSSSRARPR